MNTPVLIAARNEEDHIGQTLRHLPPNAEPIVIANGCQDKTIDIARSFESDGVKVIVAEEAGKIRALQMGLKLLGERVTEPFVTLDADTRPLFPKLWIRGLLQDLSKLGEGPAMVSGPLIFGGMDIMSAIWRNCANAGSHALTRNNSRKGVFGGANMLLRLQSPQAAQQFLEAPNVWPKDDAALRDIIVLNGGQAVKSIDPRASCLTDYDRYPGLRFRLSQGRAACQNVIWQSYVNDAAPGSVSYDDFKQTYVSTELI